jgi:kumamolisin
MMPASMHGQSLLTRHVRQAVSDGQAKFLNRLPATRTLRLDIVLPVRDEAGLEKFLLEVYDPSNPSYRQFLTVPEFTARFGPTQEDYAAVVDYLTSYGFNLVGGSRDAMDVQVVGTVTSIETAFNVSMGIYQHPTENRTFYAPDREPTVGLPFPLWHISGLDNYSIPRPALLRNTMSVGSAGGTGSGPSGSFLGSDMRAAYYGSGSLTGSGQNIGLLEFHGYDIADLNTYYTNVGQTRTATVTGISTDGTSLTCLHSQGCDDTEQIIDMTQALGMAPGISTLYVYVGSTDTAILGAMSSDTPLPVQLSSSWMWKPADPTQDDPYFYKMAAQGQSFFQASGDCGAYPNAGLTCNTSGFYYPAEDANVTAVGGTDLATSSAGGPWSSETAWLYSGGGISPDEIPIPSWQQLSGVINSSNGGSTVYRNIPDVAANANFSFYVCADQEPCTENMYGGTSFAAPMWASYVALANQQEHADTGKTLGFINPAIYQVGVGSGYSAAFHDITSGNNDCCGQKTWYDAVSGYDLVTGWGSPNGSGLISHWYATGWASVSGSLRSCWNGHIYVPDSGTATITVNHHSDTVGWGSGGTASSVASSLAQEINADGSAFVRAWLAGTTVNLISKVIGAGGNYSLSVSSVTQNQSCGAGTTSFPITASGSSLTGGH